MSSPDISVVMCVRNGERYIAEALDSLAAQDMPRIETLIVDDGSTDRTVEIAGAHGLKPTIIRQKPQGQAVALNTGIGRISGDFVCFLDHDDVWPDGRLKTMRAVLNEEPALDAVFGQVVNTNSVLQPIAAPVPARLITAMLIRNQALRRTGSFRTDIAHAVNVDWISRAEADGLRSRALGSVVLWRRIHGDNMGVRDKGTARGDMLRVIRDHHNRMRKA
jgi:glycosyltransferase involved in cell wall biosynthesis